MDWMKLAPHRSNRYNEAAGERVTIATHVVIDPTSMYTGHPSRHAGDGLQSDEFWGKLIVLHRERRQSEDNGGGGVDGEGRETLMDVMLSLQNSDPERYTDDIIKGLMTAMFSAETDSSAGTTEWAMSLLLNHPHVLEKAATEFDTKVGHERPISEDDLLNLTYLNCIIHETLRLYPATPLLAPHETSKDCTVAGFDVFAGTMLLVNAWAIHKDVGL
ncbi:hypothetical protein ZIOFF_072208 [Zingiber officinale]|uniref:Uncharacterized protein n=1 Tax=Zingiber officinale TaxID=94328 RepID=A0A8J5CV90_ZINOF|nr:hypothetical protein ZIOFF_072208 [Zingiber officinale]